MNYKIPDTEEWKLRLFSNMSKGIRGGSALIRDYCESWEQAKTEITALMLEEIATLSRTITLLNSIEPIGEERKNNLHCYPERRKNSEG